MADNCSVLDPWVYRSDSAWINETFARENEALTRALQISLSDASSSGAATPLAASPDTLSASSSPFLLQHHQLTHPSDAPLRPRIPLGPAPAGRVSKRKSRASKRSPTTYINADPANFREMVQRVTGVRIVGEPAESLVKPEPVRSTAAHRAALQQICLPTLDTSAFLLDRGSVQSADGGSLGHSADVPGFDFDSLMPAFPTLESWGVM